jgi:hypothetical protein
VTSPKRRGVFLHRADPAAGDAVWAVGPWNEREFACAALEVAAFREWSLFADMEAVVDGLKFKPAPTTLLAAQSRPGAIQQHDVDRFLSAAPLAEVVVAAGSWCEGELRTGEPLVGVQRVYWHQLAGWLRRHAQVRRHPPAPHWAAEALRSAGEELTPHEAAALGDVAVAIDAIDYATFETLAHGLQTYVRACHWTPRGRGDVGDADLGIWDGGQLDGDEHAALARFCGRLGRNADVVALLDFPREEHLRMANDAGAMGIIGKPYLLSDVAYQLADAALSRKRQGAAIVTRNP